MYPCGIFCGSQVLATYSRWDVHLHFSTIPTTPYSLTPGQLPSLDITHLSPRGGLVRAGSACSCVFPPSLSSLQSVWHTLSHVSPLQNAYKVLSHLSKATAHLPPNPQRSVAARAAVGGGGPILQERKPTGNWVWDWS